MVNSLSKRTIKSCATLFNMQPPPLPAELIDHIFSFLQEDTLALKACSKAHPLYSRLAERYLYAHIAIDSRTNEACNLILENPRLLDYPRTLEIRYIRNPPPISIMPVIPRMTNLVSLSIHDSRPYYERDEFFPPFRICIQQSSFQELHLFNFKDLPLSILDDARNIKQLTLHNCIVEDEQISSSTPSSQLSLETFTLSKHYNPYTIHRWAMRWVTRLTSLELHGLQLELDWTIFPELLTACSNSLTGLHLDMSDCM